MREASRLLFFALLVYTVLFILYSFSRIFSNASTYSDDSVNIPYGSLKSLLTTGKNGKTEDCLSLGSEEDMDLLLSKYKQVYTIQPAKTAGSSFYSFTNNCMKTTNASSFHPWGIFNKEDVLMNAFTEQLEMPSLINSQVYTADVLCSVVKHATQQSLIIYSHREETSRLVSAIRQVVGWLCFEEKKHKGFSLVEKECRVEEEQLVKIIQKKYREIGDGATELFTCEAYECIKENNANIVFMHYKKANQVQKLLAKHHCPGIGIQERNIGSDKQPVSVVLKGSKNKGTLVSLDDWLDAKSQTIHMALGLNKQSSCQGITKDLEHELLSCPDETLQISGRSYEDHKVEFPF